MSQQYMAFHQGQNKKELSRLKASLHDVNRRIFHGDKDLEVDCLALQGAINIARSGFTKWDEDDFMWITREGTMHPNFLNLETKKNKGVSLESVLVDGIEHSSTEEVLTAITEFYLELYANHDTLSQDENDDFLNQIPSLPKITCDTNALSAPIITKKNN